MEFLNDFIYGMWVGTTIFASGYWLGSAMAAKAKKDLMNRYESEIEHLRKFNQPKE